MQDDTLMASTWRRMQSALRPGRVAASMAAAALTALSIATSGCTERGVDPAEDTTGRRPGRVLLVGIDGASPRLVGPMLAAGELPTLAELARSGAYGTVRSLVPIESPPIWNTVATGKLPAAHGILGFAHEDANGDRALFFGTDRRTHALWNIVSDAGLTAGVVNFWNTYPPELIDGVMVSDHLIARNIAARREMSGADAVPPGPTVYPSEWQDRAAKIIRDREPLTDFENPLIGDPDLPGWLGLVGDDLPRRFHEDGALTRVALAIEDALHPDLLMVLLPGVDRASHFLWGSLIDDQTRYPEELRLTAVQRAAGRRALTTYYRYVDALLGHLVDRYGADDLIIVLSDHGFESGRGLGILTGVHEGDEAIDGVAFARGPGIAAGSTITNFGVADVTPSVLAWMGLPIGRDMDGRVPDFLGTARLGATGPALVDSHDIGPVPRMALRPSGAEDEIIEQLERLGYIE